MSKNTKTAALASTTLASTTLANAAPVDTAPASAPAINASEVYRTAGLRDHTKAGLRTLAAAYDGKASGTAPKGAPAMLYVGAGALASGLAGWPAKLSAIAKAVCAASGVPFEAGAPVGVSAMAEHMARHGQDTGYLWGSYVQGAPKHAKAKAGTPAILTASAPA